MCDFLFFLSFLCCHGERALWGSALWGQSAPWSLRVVVARRKRNMAALHEPPSLTTASLPILKCRWTCRHGLLMTGRHWQ